MDLLIRYWSPKHNEVWVRFYKSLFFGHALGVDVARAMLTSFENDNIPAVQLIALGRDGPNVNKTISKELEQCLKQTTSHKGFVDIGPCPLHIVHNCFEKGLAAYGQVVDQLAVDLHSLFKVSAARREDYKAIQVDLELEPHQFEQHTTVRWLSLGRAAKRIIEQWPGILKFIAELKNNPKQLPKSVSFNRIVNVTQDDVLVQLHSVCFICQLFEDFLTNFQTEKPVVHLLYDTMVELLTSVMLKFLQYDVVHAAKKDAKQLLKVDTGIVNQLPVNDIVINEATIFAAC